MNMMEDECKLSLHLKMDMSRTENVIILKSLLEKIKFANKLY